MPKYINVDDIQYTEYINGDITVSKEKIDNMIAAKVEPIVYAHWIPRKDKFWKPTIYQCSHCSQYGGAYADIFRRCPSCGAIMRKDDI